MKTLIFISKTDLTKIFCFLISIELFFIVLYIIGCFFDFSYLKKSFDLDGEKNITALFSFLQMLVLGFIYFSIYLMKETQKLKLKMLFFISGLVFVFFAFDEFFMIHEYLGRFLKKKPQTSTFSFQNGHGLWILPYLLFLVAIVLFLFTSLKRIWFLFKRESKLIALGAFIFVLGAVCLEIISYQYLRYSMTSDILYKIEVVFEEFFEMIGISIILYSSSIIRMKLQLEKIKLIDYLK